MERLMTKNIKKLVQEDMKETLKYLVGFGVCLIIVALLASISLLIATASFQIMTANFMGFLSLILFLGFLSIGTFASGIADACELPEHVRNGVTRKEYLIALTISLAVFNVIAVILVLIFGFLFGQVHLLGPASLLTLLIWPIYFTAFLVAIIFVRFHWLIGVLVLLIGFLLRRLLRPLFALVGLTLESGNLINIQWGIDGFEGMFGDNIEISVNNSEIIIDGLSVGMVITVLILTIGLGIGIYLLTKAMPIKVK